MTNTRKQILHNLQQFWVNKDKPNLFFFGSKMVIHMFRTRSCHITNKVGEHKAFLNLITQNKSYPFFISFYQRWMTEETSLKFIYRDIKQKAKSKGMILNALCIKGEDIRVVWCGGFETTKMQGKHRPYGAN